MTQSDYGTIDTNESGTVLAVQLQNARDAWNSTHKGASRPSYAQQGMTWLDDSATPWQMKLFDGVDDILLGTVDSTSNIFVPGGTAGAGAITAASVTDIGLILADFIVVNGATTITSFGLSAPIGARKQLRFASNPRIVNGASLICPWNMDLYARAGATWVVMYLGSGIWIGLNYSDSGGAGAEAPGTLKWTAAIGPPDGWLLCTGQTLAVATYPGLYAALVNTATVTITIASPGVVTWTGHPMRNGDPFKVRTTGALPTGLVAGTTYFVINKTANTFQLAATRGGAAINTTGSQSGVHTGYYAPHGDVDASNFLAPDGRDVTLLGKGDMGGTNRALIATQAAAVNLGAEFGEETHTVTAGELPSHTHGYSGTSSAAGAHTHTVNINTSDGSGGHPAASIVQSSTAAGFSLVNVTTVSSVGDHTHTYSGATDGGSGGGGAHNNLQPSLVENLIIKF